MDALLGNKRIQQVHGRHEEGQTDGHGPRGTHSFSDEAGRKQKQEGNQRGDRGDDADLRLRSAEICRIEGVGVIVDRGDGLYKESFDTK